MWEASFWGFVGGFALLVGAAAGIWLPTSRRFVGLIMAFGTGVLFSAVAFDLTSEAYDRSGAEAVVLGLLGGALVFFIGDWLIDRHGGHRRKSQNGSPEGAGAMALVLGALLDGIPESAAIGVSLVGGGSVGVAVVVAVFLSNIPESLSASVGMRKDGRTVTYVLGLWGAVLLASTISAGLGYGLLGSAPALVIAVTQSFAAGAILTMLADTMVPEAVEHAGALVGLVTAIGFTCAFLLSMTA
ncbi:ZIP family metal transporter [Nocardioides panaciterrulae]|uniref:ZIP family zinc transporter n=1 Tax=Nocardioides panaciterrulae TaxID=661492 RepID=A0A7Y9E8U2_9ACTN|nr:ZIP family zinc transporter [Nocardioides panaciterrulae]NYD43318.1 ZIP family zinc transporter [Nocardioides panaciterrulae]